MLLHAKKKLSLRRLSLDALLLSLAMLFSYLEAILPVSLLPGVRLGLSHIPVMLLFLLGAPLDAALVSFLRILCVTLPFGGVTSFLFALSGSALSFLTLPLFSRITGRVGLGILSAALHSMGQIFAALFIYGTTGLLFTYCPLLLLLSIPTGTASGILVFLLETKGGKVFEKLS